MLKNYAPLNLDFHPLVDNFNFPVVEGPLHKSFVLSKQSLSTACLDWMAANSFEFYRVLLFVLPPKCQTEHIHIDGVGEGSITYAVNWNFNVSSSDFAMQWFKPLTEGTKVAVTTTGNPIYYISFEEHEVELLESTSHLGPLLFNTRIPHRVVNYGPTTRYGISLRFTKQFSSWEETTKVFEKWMLSTTA